LNAVPLVIVSGSTGQLQDRGATFVFKKPISVEQAVRTLSAARNMILDGRLRYNRHALDLPVSLAYGPRKKVEAHLINLSEGGMGIRLPYPMAFQGPVRLGFQLPESKAPMKVQGEIAWIDKMGNAGIRFLGMSPDLKRDLKLWLARQYLTH
jgi:hypothetical protein